jgi:hypothetical protein
MARTSSRYSSKSSLVRSPCTIMSPVYMCRVSIQAFIFEMTIEFWKKTARYDTEKLHKGDPSVQRPNSWTNPDKSLKSFPPCYSQSPLQLCLEIFISSNSRNLFSISTVQLRYTVKEKGGKTDRKPGYPLPWFRISIQKPQV